MSDRIRIKNIRERNIVLGVALLKEAELHALLAAAEAAAAVRITCLCPRCKGLVSALKRFDFGERLVERTRQQVDA